MWRRKRQRGERRCVEMISRFFLNQRVDFGEVVEVLEEGNEVEDEEDAPDSKGDVVHELQFQAILIHANRDVIDVAYIDEGHHIDEQAVDNNHEDTKLRRPQFGIGEFELVLDFGVYRHIDLQLEIDNVAKQCKPEVDESGHADADEDKELADAINVVVEIVSVEFALLVSDACKRAVH